MRKSHKIHITYTLVLLLVFSILLTYEIFQTRQTRTILQDEVTQLKGQINQLQEQSTQLTNNLMQLNGSIQKREAEIKNLTGDLEQVRVESRAQVSELQENLATLKAQNQDFSQVIEEVVPLVVSIHTDLGSGSGFFIRSSGYIVTNQHVMEGARAATVTTFDGENHAVRLIGFERTADIAIIKIEGDFDALEFGNSANTNIGERVIAVGNPGGLDFSVAQGIVSAFRTDPSANELIQIDVPINPGNSGGPLVNAQGKVIGVNTKKIKGFEGVGFALASNFIDDIVDKIINTDQI